MLGKITMGQRFRLPAVPASLGDWELSVSRTFQPVPAASTNDLARSSSLVYIQYTYETHQIQQNAAEQIGSFVTNALPAETSKLQKLDGICKGIPVQQAV